LFTNRVLIILCKVYEILKNGLYEVEILYMSSVFCIVHHFHWCVKYACVWL